jgi:hypothetical protein
MAEIGHLFWIRPISPCDRLAKKGLQDSDENFIFFQEKSRVFLNSFLVFLEILAKFAVPHLIH